MTMIILDHHEPGLKRVTVRLRATEERTMGRWPDGLPTAIQHDVASLVCHDVFGDPTHVASALKYAVVEDAASKSGTGRRFTTTLRD